MKKKLLILIPILVLIIIGIFIFVYFKTDIFKSNKDLFWKYFTQEIDILDTFTNSKIGTQGDFRKNNSYIMEGKLALVLKQGENSSKQLNIETSARHDVNTKRTYADATLKNGDINLFNVSYVNSGDIYAIRCSEIYNNYVGIRNSDLKNFVYKYNPANNLDNLNSSNNLENTADINNILSNINVPNSIDLDTYTNVINFNDEQKEHIKNTYEPIILNNIQDSQYEKLSNIEIQIEDNIYATNQYVLRIDKENVKNILLACLNTLKNDTETLQILSSKFSEAGLGVEYTDTNNLLIKINEFEQTVEKKIAEMDNEILEINIYEKSGKALRTNIKFKNFTLQYDKTDNTKSIEITFEQENNEQVDINTNEIIDLNKLNDMSNTIKSSISISNSENDDYSTITISLIPDVNNTEEYIKLICNIGNIANNEYSNSYSFEGSNGNNIVNIEYNTKTVKTEQVEEITELNNSNTAIANDYTSEQFKPFINEWTNQFVKILTSKLEIIGFTM